jgi:hypothetical protein
LTSGRVEHTAPKAVADPVLTLAGQFDLSLGPNLISVDETLGAGANEVSVDAVAIAPGDPLGLIELFFTGFTGFTIAGIGVGMDCAAMLFVETPVSAGAGSAAFIPDLPGGLTLIGVSADVPVFAAPPRLPGGSGMLGLIRKRA